MKSTLNFVDSNGYIYYISELLGENQFAICRKLQGNKSIGNHKWKSSSNKICTNICDAEKILIKEALKRGWVKIINRKERKEEE